MMARIARPLQSLRGAQWPQRATARCNYSAATLRRKTCVFPFARQREWMCQNYGHRAQRDATTARLRRALTGDSLERTRAARSRHRAVARCNYHAAEPRSKTCVFPFARQREWMCQNYGHRAQRDATTARRSRVAKHVSFHSRGSANGCAKTTGIARSAMQLQRGYAAPSLQIL